MVFFCKHNVSLGAVIKIFGVVFFFKHGYGTVREANYNPYSTRLMVQPIDLVSCIFGVSPFSKALSAFLR